MIVPAFLIRLMHRFPLSRGLRLGAEDRLAIEVADACRAWTLEGRLRAVWWHSAGEVGGAKAQARMAVAKALGLIPGTPDLVFIGGEMLWGATDTIKGAHRVLLLELKSAKGRRTDNQADFAAWASSLDIAYLICRSLKDVEDALIRHGILTPAKGSTAHADR